MTEPIGDLLFDSTALIDLYRGLSPFQRYADALAEGQRPYVSVLTEAELWRGLKPHEVERHEALISLFIRLPLESAAARRAGAWMKEYEERGLGWMDALIVASASLAKLTILTRDGRLARCLASEASFREYRL